MDEFRGQLKEVITHLCDGRWHSVYSIHDRYRLSPDVIRRCVMYLKEKKLVFMDGMNVRLNVEIEESFVSELIHVFLFSSSGIVDDERFVPHPKLEIDDLYVPRIDLLSNELNSDK